MFRFRFQSTSWTCHQQSESKIHLLESEKTYGGSVSDSVWQEQIETKQFRGDARFITEKLDGFWPNKQRAKECDHQAVEGDSCTDSQGWDAQVSVSTGIMHARHHTRCSISGRHVGSQSTGTCSSCFSRRMQPLRTSMQPGTVAQLDANQL